MSFLQVPNVLSSPDLRNLREFNAKGDGVSDDSPVFTNAIANTISTLFIPSGTYLLSQNLTVPANIRLVFDLGAKIKIASTKTLTILGMIETSAYNQIFDLSLGGTINGTTKVREIYPQWFGAKGDGTTNDTVAIQAVVNFAISSGRKSLFFPNGQYFVTALTSADQVEFVGNNVTFTGGYVRQAVSLEDTVSKIKAYGNVIAYGAKGDGNNDDTAAIQKCVDECYVVEFPAGYFLTKTINVGVRTVIKGQYERTIIRAHPDAVGNIFSLDDTAGSVTIEELRIDGNMGVNLNPLNAIGDKNPGSTYEKQVVKIRNVTVMNLNGTAFYFPARGLTYLLESLWTWNCKDYGIYFGAVSDSEIRGCHIGGAYKAGISINNGANFRIVGTKVCLSGTGDTPYAGVELNSASYASFSGCEIQQNCYDGVLLNNSYGNIFTGCVFDSNNKIGLSGLYGQLKVTNGSSFNRVDSVFVDGRFKDHPVPYNIASLYGIISDEKSCYNAFHMTYSPNNYSSSEKRFIPYYTPLPDISSTYKINSFDYYDFTSTNVVIGDNASVSVNKAGDINALCVGNGKSINVTMQAAATLSTTSNSYFFQRIPLDVSKLNLTNKSMIYVTYLSKVVPGINIDCTLAENSTPHPTTVESGFVRLFGANRNTEFMYNAMYKPINYSAEAGFAAYFNVSMSVESGFTVNQNDILTTIKNIKISVV